MSNGTIGAGFVKGEKNGNMITPKGSNNGGGSTVEELSSYENLEQAGLDDPEGVVVEFEEGDSKIRERKENGEKKEHVVKLEVDTLVANDRLEKFFSDSEIETLQETEELVEGESKPEDIEEVWDGIRQDVKRHNKEVAKRKKREEIKKAKEFAKKGTKYDKEVSELKGDELVSLLNEGMEGSGETESEELEAAIESINQKYEPILGESEPEIKEPEVENLEDGLEAFRDHENPVFEELADDLEKSDELTQFESVEGGKKVTTREPELRDAILNNESEPFDGSVEIHNHDKESGTVVATVRREGE